MEKKSVYNYIATNLREEASHLLGSVHQCVTYRAIDEAEAKRLRSLIYEFYNLSYNIEKKYH